MKTEITPKKVKKIKPYTNKWERLAGEVARQFVGDIYPCGTCGYPVVKGYICIHCGEDSGCPREHKP